MKPRFSKARSIKYPKILWVLIHLDFKNLGFVEYENSILRTQVSAKTVIFTIL